MPGVKRLFIEQLTRNTGELIAPGIPATALFSVIDVELAEKACNVPGPINPRIISCSTGYASHHDMSNSGSGAGWADGPICQMDPANSHETLYEGAMDLTESADVLILKPGTPFLDVLYRVKQALGVQTFVYQVSGEYALHEAAFANDCLDEKTVGPESLRCFKRAGADGIVSWFARRTIQALRML